MIETLPAAYEPPAQPEGKSNTTDPDSRNIKAYRGNVQGYNAQAVITRAQIIAAAEIAPEGIDFTQLDSMVSAAEKELEGAGVSERPEMVVADAGYENKSGFGRLAGLLGGGFSPAPAGPSKGLLGMGAAGLVGYALGRRRNAPPEYSLLMVVASSGVVPCRYPTSPASLPVAVGDRIELSGRLYPDNTARAWRCRNLSTGVSHRARIVSPWVPLAAIASLALCLYVVVGVLSAT